MDEMRTQLDALRQELDMLAARLESVKSEVADEGDSVSRLQRHLQEDLARHKEKVANLGVLRSVVLIDKHGGNSTSAGETVYGSADNLPSADAFVQYITTLASEPLALRALHALIVGHYEGKPLQQTKASLAAALQVGEAEIERAMLPLVDRDILRWGKNAKGEEYYVLNRHDMIALLSFAG